MSSALFGLQYVLFSALIVVNIVYLLKYIRHLHSKQFHLMMFAIILVCLVFELISVPFMSKAVLLFTNDPADPNYNDILHNY